MEAALSVSVVVITAVIVYAVVRWARSLGSRSQGTSIAGNIMKLYNEMYMPSAAKSIENRLGHPAREELKPESRNGD